MSRWIIAALALMSLSACHHGVTDGSSVEELVDDEGELVVIKGASSGPCHYNRIIGRSDGLGLAAYFYPDSFLESVQDSFPEGFTTITFEDDVSLLERETGFSQHYVMGERRVYPVSWPDALILRSGPTRIAATRSVGESVFSFETIPSIFTNFELRSSNSSDIVATLARHVDENETPFQPQQYARRHAFVNGELISFLAVDTGDGQKLVHAKSDGGIDELESASFFRRAALGPSSAVEYMTYLGAANYLVSSHPQPYEQAIRDQDDWQTVGIFTPWSIFIDETEHSLPILEIGGAASIVDAIGVESGVHLLVKTERARFVMYFSYYEEKFSPPREICSAWGASLARAPTEVLQVERANAGQSLDQGVQFENFETIDIGVLSRSRATEDRRLLVFFHGGPGGSALDSLHNSRVNQFLEDGFDILRFEYAGSVGLGLERSLRLTQVVDFGFELDSAELRTWISENNYSEVVIYAESFGAVPAFTFLRLHGILADRAVFVAPLAALTRDRSETQSSTIGEIAARDQSEFEAGVFGSWQRRQDFAQWVQDLVSSVRFEETHLVIYGENDSQTPPFSFLSRAKGDYQYLSVPNASHLTVSVDPVVQNRLRCHVLDVEC